MARRERFVCADIIGALQRYKGVYLAAAELKCSASTVYRYIHKYASVKEAWDQIDGETTDLAVIALRGAIGRSEPWAVKFQLSTKGRNRGYGTQLNIRHLLPLIDMEALPDDILARIADGEDMDEVLADYMNQTGYEEG